MIPQRSVNRFAHQTGVDLHIAQQDVVLLYALALLHEEGVLRGLAFKGGTYLRKMVLGRDSRFSEDLDFTATGISDDAKRVFEAAFREPFHGVRFNLVAPTSTQSNWRSTVAYEHAWDRGTFTLEVSRRERPFLPPEARSPIEQAYFQELPFRPPPVPCLRMPEALAEKLRATQQRASERDIYDLTRYARGALPEPLVRLLAAGKLWSVREAFDPDRLLGRLTEVRRDWPDLRDLLGRADGTDWNAEARKAAVRFAFLRELTPFEQRLVADHRRHAMEGELRAELGRLVP